MKLVFFDIECACVYKNSAKICAFGYVVCDEKFKILKKEDILINPRGKFHLTDGRGERGLVLPYEYNSFKDYPIFPEVYPKIKKLLEDKNSLIFGHATLNDVKYLDLDAHRYNLPSLNFEFSDSQLMYMTSIGDFTKQFGLSTITSALDVTFTPHRAADDAYATMMVVQALCKKHNCTCAQLGSVLGIKTGKISGGKITRPDSDGYIKYRENCQKIKEERTKRHSEFFRYVNSKHKVKSHKLDGVVFNFSRELEDNLKLSIPLIEKIYSLGGKYSHKLADCNVYVAGNNDNSVRTLSARGSAEISVISILQLSEKLDD